MSVKEDELKGFDSRKEHSYIHITYEAVDPRLHQSTGAFFISLFLFAPGRSVGLFFEGVVHLLAAPSCIRAAWSAICGLKAMQRTIQANSCSRGMHIMPDVPSKVC